MTKPELDILCWLAEEQRPVSHLGAIPAERSSAWVRARGGVATPHRRLLPIARWHPGQASRANGRAPQRHAVARMNPHGLTDWRLLAAAAHRPKTYDELRQAALELRSRGLRVDDVAQLLGRWSHCCGPPDGRERPSMTPGGWGGVERYGFSTPRTSLLVPCAKPRLFALNAKVGFRELKCAVSSRDAYSNDPKVSQGDWVPAGRQFGACRGERHAYRSRCRLFR